MNTQPETLICAEALEKYPAGWTLPDLDDPTKFHMIGYMARKSAAELRRLHEVNQSLLDSLRDLLHAFPGEYENAPAHITQARAAIAKATS